MTNLMLSWQQAALVALGCGVAGLALVYGGRASLAWRWGIHVGPFLREAGVVIGLYALWQLAGNFASGGYQAAITHAWWVWDTERALRLPSELDLQRLLLPHPLLSEIANLYYATMHFGLLIAMLVWLFVRHRDGYPAVRNAMAASTAACLLISFIPVAPPRLLPGSGIVDLAARYGESVYAAMGSTLGADQLSAMPSVHVAWSILVAWAVVTRARSRWRWLILLHPAATIFVVVATGNHFWADAIVAAAIDAAAIMAASLLARRASAGLDGVHHRVAQVRPQLGIEGSATRDEAQLRIGRRAVDSRRREAVLGVLTHIRHTEHRERPVRTAHVHAVAGVKRGQPEEDPGASAGVNVPGDDR